MKSHNSKYFIPPLLKISPIEANAIVSMFRLYDYKATGKIPRHLAKKLTISLGFDVPIGNLSSEIGVRELLLFLDQWCPEKDPPLPNSLHFFNRLACEPTVDDNESDHVTSNSISNFMDSLGRPPISKGEVRLLHVIFSILFLLFYFIIL